MKQYKLIKEYPQSPKLGSIAKWGKHGVTGLCYKVEDGVNGIYKMLKKDIENFPEFWLPIETITFDGKAIIEGEELWWLRVVPDETGVETLYNYGQIIWDSGRLSLDGTYLFFSSKEKCEEFLTQRRYSIRDIQIVYALVNSDYNIFEFFERLYKTQENEDK